jgi:hypothetical protein
LQPVGQSSRPETLTDSTRIVLSPQDTILAEWTLCDVELTL